MISHWYVFANNVHMNNCGNLQLLYQLPNNIRRMNWSSARNMFNLYCRKLIHVEAKWCVYAAWRLSLVKGNICGRFSDVGLMVMIMTMLMAMTTTTTTMTMMMMMPRTITMMSDWWWRWWWWWWCCWWWCWKNPNLNKSTEFQRITKSNNNNNSCSNYSYYNNLECL